LQLRLASAENYKLPMDYELIAYQTRLAEEYVKSLIEDFGLFTIENDVFYCDKIIEKMQLFQAKKEAGRKAGKASAEARFNGRVTETSTVVEQSLEPSSDNKEKKESNINKVNNKLLSFDNFWNLYEKKGNRKKSLQYFLKLDEETIQLILTKVPGYVLATPDSQYRKNGETYLYGECWNDTLPVKPKDKTLTPMQQQNSSINESWATDEPWEGLELEDGTFVIPS